MTKWTHNDKEVSVILPSKEALWVYKDFMWIFWNLDILSPHKYDYTVRHHQDDALCQYALLIRQ